ncbi:MFS transporter, partial [Candidatus Shapirobacteria bacterium]|nr:MFS transporter [Candidatus Shapirobacteria bacterium]
MKKQFLSLTLVSTFRHLAFGLLSLFSPIYIFQIIFGVFSMEATVKVGVIGVLLYMLLFYLIKILTFPLAENFAFKLGFKNVIAISFLPFFLYLGFLILSEKHLYFLAFSAFFGGLQAGLFWFGYHGMFVKAVNEHSFGFHESICNSLGILTLLVTPILGSLLIFFFGFTSLFLTAGVFVLLAAVALVFAHRDKPLHDARFLTSFILFKK